MIAAGLVFLAAVAPLVAADQTGRTVLATGSLWRSYVMSRPASAEPVRAGDDPSRGPRVLGTPLNTPAAPAGWMKADFDDSEWARVRGPVTTGGGDGGGKAVIYFRGRFGVDDPGAVRAVTIDLAYRGGVAVYLNGAEVLRRDMPEGEIAPGAPADAYPLDAYLDRAGEIIPDAYHAAKRIKAGDADLARRVGLRSARKVESAALPARHLHKGVNVLAIEVHRAAVRPEAIQAARKRAYWPHVGLESVRLSVDGGGVRPNVARPGGGQVWVEDVNSLFSILRYGDPFEPPRPVRIAGVANGIHSGQVVIGSTLPIEGLTATVGELKARDGAGVIPADRIDIRYAAANALGVNVRRTGMGLARAPWNPVPGFSALMDDPPAKIAPATLKTRPRDRLALGLPAKATPAAVQPIWVTVRIPKAAPAGTYTGTLTITARGIKPIRVPIELLVSGWTLPEARDFRTFVGLYQSPLSVAIQYGAPMWSDAHLAAMDRSWRLMGMLGNNLLVIPLVKRTMFGNDDSYVPWVGRDGRYTFDFTAHDKLVRLAMKHCRIRVIAYQVYLPSGWTPPAPDKPTFVTTIDPDTGERGELKLPPFGTAEALALWKPLMDAIPARLKALGAGDVKVVLGIGQDGGIHKTVIEHFAQIAPGLKWEYGAHNRPRGWRLKPYDFAEYLYVPKDLPPAGQAKAGWRDKDVILMSQRIHDRGQTPMVVRTMAERALLIGDRGPGRMCLDYWPVQGARKGNHGGSLFSRWPESSAAQRTPHLKIMSCPGPAGAVPTVKTMAFREGLQEAEARIFLADALAAGRVPADLAGRVRAALAERTEYCRLYHAPRPFIHAAGRGWRRLSAETFRLAAEVAGKR